MQFSSAAKVGVADEWPEPEQRGKLVKSFAVAGSKSENHEAPEFCHSALTEIMRELRPFSPEKSGALLFRGRPAAYRLGLADTSLGPC